MTTQLSDAVVAAEKIDRRRRLRFGVSMVGLIVLLVVVVTLAVSYGAVSIPLRDVWTTIGHHLLHGSNATPTDVIIWQVRAPRVFLAVLVGCVLSLVGVTVQALVRNPLADPYVLGVESGAAAAAVAVLYLGRESVNIFGATPTVAAFVGAIGTLLLVFAIARYRGRVSATRLLLVGVAMSYALSGITSFFLYASHDPAAQEQVLFWMMGGLGGATWSSLPPAFGVLVVLFIVVRWFARPLNALAVGDTTALSLGLSPDRLRILLLVVCSLGVAVIVTLAGPIGFVGLVVPHMGRMLFGADHRRLIPAALVLGGIYLAAVDLASRVIFAPSEIPIGVMTAILGTPFFLWLIRHRERSDA